MNTPEALFGRPILAQLHRARMGKNPRSPLVISTGARRNHQFCHFDPSFREAKTKRRTPRFFLLPVLHSLSLVILSERSESKDLHFNSGGSGGLQATGSAAYSKRL